MKLGKDIWRMIFKKFEDDNDYKIMNIVSNLNTRFRNNIFNETFFKNAWLEKFGNEEKTNGLIDVDLEKEDNWKKTYLYAIKILRRLKVSNNYTYTEGNYMKQYSICNYYRWIGSDDLLMMCINNREYSLFKHFADNRLFYYPQLTKIVEKIIDCYVIDSSNLFTGPFRLREVYLKNYIRMLDCILTYKGFEGDFLSIAAGAKCLNMVKYIAENYPNSIKMSGDEALKIACIIGDLSIVKYLVMVHKISLSRYRDKDDYYRFLARSNNHMDILEFLNENF